MQFQLFEFQPYNKEGNIFIDNQGFKSLQWCFISCNIAQVEKWCLLIHLSELMEGWRRYPVCSVGTKQPFFWSFKRCFVSSAGEAKTSGLHVLGFRLRAAVIASACACLSLGNGEEQEKLLLGEGMGCGRSNYTIFPNTRASLCAFGAAVPLAEGWALRNPACFTPTLAYS